MVEHGYASSDGSLDPVIVSPVEEAPNQVVISGLRGVATLAGRHDSLINVTAAPAELFRRIEITGFGECQKVLVFPNHCEKIYGGGGRVIRCRFFAAREAPWVAMLIEKNEPGPLVVKLRMTPHLDYISKFHGTADHTSQFQPNRAVIHCSEHPELQAVVITDGAIESESVSDHFSLALDLTAEQHFVVIGGGVSTETAACLNGINLDAVVVEFKEMIRECTVFLNGGAQLSTPDAEIDRFFRNSRIWFMKSRRLLRFGSPHAMDGALNQEIPVLTASPDYHGLFANDCVQTSYEGMLVAPGYRDLFENGLEVLLRYMPHCHGYMPEAVEYIHGDRRVFIQPLKIGQHPEWIVSVASLILLTGDKALGRRYWEHIKRLLRFFQDSNGDGISEWDESGYPEQPDTTGYRNGMLYAQAWWVWAYRLAAEVAKFLNKGSHAADLRLRSKDAEEAMERTFGRADGYGSWLSADGALHPHKGHCMIIPIALDMCPANRAERVLETIQNAEIWLEPYGPRRSDDKHRIAGGDTVWAFMRWTLVAALFRAGHAGRAAELAGQWARDELAEGLPAPESFPTAITGITGNGYVWTAARAIRALTYGLFGISLRADGFSCKPVLPAGWSYVTLRNFPFRNKTVTIRVERNPNTIARLNGNAKDTPLVLDRELNQHGANELLITIQ